MAKSARETVSRQPARPARRQETLSLGMKLLHPTLDDIARRLAQDACEPIDHRT
jgi:hypothetical protein